MRQSVRQSVNIFDVSCIYIYIHIYIFTTKDFLIRHKKTHLFAEIHKCYQKLHTFSKMTPWRPKTLNSLFLNVNWFPYHGFPYHGLRIIIGLDPISSHWPPLAPLAPIGPIGLHWLPWALIGSQTSCLGNIMKGGHDEMKPHEGRPR